MVIDPFLFSALGGVGIGFGVSALVYMIGNAVGIFTALFRKEGR